MAKDQHRASEALKEALRLAKARVALSIEAAGVGVYDHHVSFEAGTCHSDGCAELLGLTRSDLPDPAELPVWLLERIHPNDRARLRGSYVAFLGGGSAEFNIQARVRHRAGNWISVRGLSRAVTRDKQGRIERVVGVMLDVTARRQADGERERLLARERAARAEAKRTHRRYHEVVESVGCVVFEADPSNNRFTFVNGWVEPMLGYPVERWYEQGFWSENVVQPDDRDVVLQAFAAKAERNSESEIEFRARRADGSVIWLRGLIRPDPCSADGSTLVRGILVDITKRKQWEQQEQLLLAEIDHRSKNMLAAVQSMIQLTARNAVTIDDYVEALVDRIHALSRAHDLLRKESWQGARFRNLVRDELSASTGARSERAKISGADVFLQPRAAQSLSLILHELATNAAKYGALSRPEGRINVSCSVTASAGSEILRVDWVESGGPPVAPPKNHGFGILMVERSVAHDLDGLVRFDFPPQGVCCRMKLPAARVVRQPGAEPQTPRNGYD